MCLNDGRSRQACDPLEGVDVLREASLQETLGVQQLEEVVCRRREILSGEQLLCELTGRKGSEVSDRQTGNRPSPSVQLIIHLEERLRLVLEERQIKDGLGVREVESGQVRVQTRGRRTEVW